MSDHDSPAAKVLPETERHIVIVVMEEILHHLGCIKLCKFRGIYHINWCRICSINSSGDDNPC